MLIRNMFNKKRVLWSAVILLLLAAVIVTAVVQTSKAKEEIMARKSMPTVYPGRSGEPAGGMPGMPGMMPGMTAPEMKGGEDIQLHQSKAETAVSTQVPWGAAEAASTPRMVISTAGIKLEVEDAQKSSERVTDIARRAGGFVTQSIVNKFDEGTTATVTVRIPSIGYSSALREISKLGRVLSKSEDGQDVTEEYVDLESRQRNLRSEEEAFLRVLDKASKIPDVLAVERELSRVRGEIEQVTGRIKYLKNQVSLATISVELMEPGPIVQSTTSWSFERTIKGTWNSFLIVLRSIASVFIFILVFTPLWLGIILVVFGIRKVIHRRQA